MRWFMKLCCIIALSSVCMFTAMGYAAITSNVSLGVETILSPPHEIFITGATSSGENGGKSVAQRCYSTVVDSKTTLDANENSSATLHLTIFNNTPDIYAFKGVEYAEEFYSNDNITFSLQGISVGDKVVPGQIINVDLTFKYDDYNGTEESLSSILNIHFHLSGIDAGTDYEDYIYAFLNNSKGYGLNNTNKKGTEVYNNLKNYQILYAHDNIQGGNLKHLVESVNSVSTSALTFIYDYENETKIILYTYEDKYADSSHSGETITVYKTIFEREPVGNGYSEWGATSTESGKAVIKSITTASGTKVYSIAVNDWTPNN